MIEDYYKILNLKPKTSLYKIALHYKINSMKILESQKDFELKRRDLYLINSAFEVLKNEQVRLYYDILYKILILNKQTGISNQTVEKYLSIINYYIEKGEVKADKIVNNEKFILTISIKRPLFFSYLLGTIMLYMRYPRFTTSPLGGFISIVIGLFLYIRAHFGILPDTWFLGLIFVFYGLINVYVNFRCFTIDLMNKEK